MNSKSYSNREILLLLLMLSSVNFLGYGNYIMAYGLIITIIVSINNVYSIICRRSFLLLFLANLTYSLFLSIGQNAIDTTVFITALIMPASAFITGAAYMRCAENQENRKQILFKAIILSAISAGLFAFFTSRKKGSITTTYSALYQLNQQRNSLSIWNGVSIGATALAMYLLPCILLLFFSFFCLKGFKRVTTFICGLLCIVASFNIASRLNIFSAVLIVVISYFMAMKRNSGMNRMRILAISGFLALCIVIVFMGNLFGFRDMFFESVLMQRLSYYKGNVFSSVGRLEIYVDTMSQIIRNPLGGIIDRSGVSSHNIFLQYAIGGGWLSLVLVVMFFVKIYKNIIMGIKRYPSKDVYFFVVPLLIGFLGIVMVEAPLLSNPLMYSVFISYIAMIEEYYLGLKKADD